MDCRCWFAATRLLPAPGSLRASARRTFRAVRFDAWNGLLLYAYSAYCAVPFSSLRVDGLPAANAAVTTALRLPSLTIPVLTPSWFLTGHLYAALLELCLITCLPTFKGWTAFLWDGSFAGRCCGLYAGRVWPFPNVRLPVTALGLQTLYIAMLRHGVLSVANASGAVTLYFANLLYLWLARFSGLRYWRFMVIASVVTITILRIVAAAPSAIAIPALSSVVWFNALRSGLPSPALPPVSYTLPSSACLCNGGSFIMPLRSSALGRLPVEQVLSLLLPDVHGVNACAALADA